MDLFVACQQLLKKIPDLDKTQEAEIFVSKIKDEYESVKIAQYLHRNRALKELVNENLAKMEKLETTQQNDHSLMWQKIIESLFVNQNNNNENNGTQLGANVTTKNQPLSPVYNPPQIENNNNNAFERQMSQYLQPSMNNGNSFNLDLQKILREQLDKNNNPKKNDRF